MPRPRCPRRSRRYRVDCSNLASRGNAPRERIVVGENQFGLRANMRAAAYARANMPCGEFGRDFIAGFEHAADDAFLAPLRAGRERAVGGEARDLRTRAGAARRTVVSLAGTQHEI